MDDHFNYLGRVGDAATQQEAEQLHADALDALRHCRAFMLVTVGDDGQPRARCTFNKRMGLSDTRRFAVGCIEAAQLIAMRCAEIVQAAYQQDEDAA